MVINMNKQKTCFFTGHRQIPEHERERIEKAVLENIEKLCEIGYDTFICGGAVGFDTLCAKAVLQKRKEHDIKLFLYLPCNGQDKYFSEKQKEDYANIRKNADSVTVLFDKYIRGCMHARNRKMADDSSVCIAYCTSDTGGSAYTVKYAGKKSVEIIKI